MLIRATRTLSALTLRVVFYGWLFVTVVVAHLALTAALRELGWNGGASLLVSGAVVLAFVLFSLFFVDWVRARRAAAREAERLRQGLPEGPCCVVWQGGAEAEADMPWEVAGPLRARYPALARRLGVEGVAVVEFEINAEGAAKNIHCAYAWPSRVFFDAAREALLRAKFEPKPETHVRFGATFRVPFVFRIAGAADIQEPGRRASRLSPHADAARQLVDKLAGRA
jgi:TonB family protein